MNKRMNRAIWLALLIGIFLLLCCSCGNSGGNSDGNSDGNGSVAEGGSTGEADSGKCEHLFDDGTVLRAAGCDRDGEMRYTCSLCGYSYTKAIPGGHTPVKDPAVPATCSAEGKTEGSHCSVCGKVLTAQVTVPKSGHTPVKDPAVPATCSAEGKTEGSHCSVCGTVLTAQVTVPKGGHTPVKDPAVPATCSAEGKTEGSHCSVCGKVLTAQVTVPKSGHKFADGWTSDGTYHWHASTCGHTSEVSGKAAHSYSGWMIDRAATEETVGEKHRVCTVCYHTETEEIPKLSHTHKFADGWTSDGTYHWHASTCGHTSEVSGKAAHSYSDGVCSVCGAKDPRVAVRVYIDGILSETLYTDEKQGYRITAPQKPADITTDPNAEGYFYAWFTDRDFQVPLLDTTEFRRNGAIYGKWIQIDYSCFTYTVSEGKATITKFNNSYKKATVVIVPAYINGFPVKAISSAFENDTWLRTVILCNGIEKISADAFKGCNSITQIDLPESLTEIGDRAFAGCSILQDIRIPGNVKSIGDYAFEDCAGLRSITIPDGVTWIGEGAFSGCTGLQSITLPFTGDALGDYPFFGYIFGAFEAYSQDKYVPSSLKSVTITKNISAGAFQNCAGLQSITMPDSVTSIGNSTFSGCKGLQSIVIPEGVTEIGDYAFSGCSGLQSIAISSNVTWIGKRAFGSCAGLQSITVAPGNKKYHSAGNCLIETASKTLILGCQSSVIPADGSVREIGDYAFYGCKGLQSITIPDSVTRIGDSAFDDCTGLQSFTIPSSVKYIGESAFNNCTGLTSIKINGTSKWGVVYASGGTKEYEVDTTDENQTCKYLVMTYRYYVWRRKN